jgi:transmembrane protein
MPAEPDPHSVEPPTIHGFMIDALVLYAVSHYPSARSIELLSRTRNCRSAKGMKPLPSPALPRPRPDPTSRSMPMSAAIQRFLQIRPVALAGRIALTFPFWGSGLSKLADFQGAMAEMTHFGLEPPALIAAATILVQLAGSLLIITNRLACLGAGALGIFTALTIPLVHHFWSIAEEPFRTIAFHTATEHVGMIGGLILASILAGRPAAAAA